MEKKEKEEKKKRKIRDFVFVFVWLLSSVTFSAPAAATGIMFLPLPV